MYWGAYVVVAAVEALVTTGSYPPENVTEVGVAPPNAQVLATADETVTEEVDATTASGANISVVAAMAAA
jgi:hypothetical protein